MHEYVSEFLLVLSVIGTPIILGALLFYGMTMSERRNSAKPRERRAEGFPKRNYADDRRDNGTVHRKQENSRRDADVSKRRPGMTG